MPPRIYPRFAERALTIALGDSPVVLIHGPRQRGKTTLAQMVGDRRKYAYLTFDSDVTRAAAATDNPRLSLRVVGGNGRISGYASLVDNRTNDGTYVPAQ